MKACKAGGAFLTGDLLMLVMAPPPCSTEGAFGASGTLGALVVFWAMAAPVVDSNAAMTQADFARIGILRQSFRSSSIRSRAVLRNGCCPT